VGAPTPLAPHGSYGRARADARVRRGRARAGRSAVTAEPRGGRAAGVVLSRPLHAARRPRRSAAGDGQEDPARRAGDPLTSFDGFDSAGWLRADAISADLTGGASAGYLYSGEVSKEESLSGPAGRARAVAAVNGDFFDINNSGAAQGVGIHDGDLVQSPTAGHDNAVAITADGIGRVLRMHFDGTATPEGRDPVTLTQFNQLIQGDGVGPFAPLWGS
jgi:hypothetical protein